ncbi:hypothetical protein CNX70_22660 [Janthinobacterium svalbardensis]|uniref:Uncharacterized protein n=1 Tax=Janthinobacterium svalbardensis TaxID=368607 RepID=A0A290X173_9BURK|nr:hypothetical protein CNX70_22660 [Janthinobacterium svalbardensis]
MLPSHESQRASYGRIAPGKRLIVRMQGAQFALVILQQLIHASLLRLIGTCRYSLVCIIEEAGNRKIEFEQDYMHQQGMPLQRWHSTFVHSLPILIDLFETIVLNQEVTQNQSSWAFKHRIDPLDA